MSEIQLEFFGGPLDGQEQWVPVEVTSVGEYLQFRVPIAHGHPGERHYHIYRSGIYMFQGRLTLDYCGWQVEFSNERTD